MNGAPPGAACCILAALLTGGCAPELEALPPLAVAEGVVVEGTGPSRYRVLLAEAEGRLGGKTVAATGTVVSRPDDGKPPLAISSSSSDWDLRSKRAVFTGNVVVTRADVTLRCARLEVAYAPGDSIDTVVATGGVVVERGARVARAERAELAGRTGQVTLTQGPRLLDGPNELVGERIVLWLDDERVQCEGGDGAPCSLVVSGWTLGR